MREHYTDTFEVYQLSYFLVGTADVRRIFNLQNFFAHTPKKDDKPIT